MEYSLQLFYHHSNKHKRSLITHYLGIYSMKNNRYINDSNKDREKNIYIHTKKIIWMLTNKRKCSSWHVKFKTKELDKVKYRIFHMRYAMNS